MLSKWYMLKYSGSEKSSEMQVWKIMVSGGVWARQTCTRQIWNLLVDAVIKHSIGGQLHRNDNLRRVEETFVRKSHLGELKAPARSKDVLVQKSK